MDLDSWAEMTLPEQFGNIGSDVDRVISWEKKGKEELKNNAFHRALYQIDMTISCGNYKGAKLKEMCRLREVFCDSFFGGHLYNTPMEYFQKYFFQFAVLANKNK